MTDKKIRIEFCNISEGKFLRNQEVSGVIQLVCSDMKLKAIEYVQQKVDKANGKLPADLELAKELKKCFDDFFHPTWQCVVGRNFGSEIGFEEAHMIYFYIGFTAILLWKAG